MDDKSLACQFTKGNKADAKMSADRTTQETGHEYCAEHECSWMRRGRRNLRDCDDRVDEGGLLHTCQYCPAAIHHAISAPNGPVAVAKVRGREMFVSEDIIFLKQNHIVGVI